MSINVSAIPPELRDLPQWVNWRREERDGKPTKIPYQPCGRKRAASNDRETWSQLVEVVAAIKRDPTLSGIGFVFSMDDPYFGLDLDHVRDPATGLILPWSDQQRACEHWAAGATPDPEQIIEVLSASCYCEVSPSGTGVHLIGRAEIPRGRKLGDLEIYKLGRFFTVTGNATQSAPEPLADCTTTIESILRVFDCKPKPAKRANRKPRPDQQPQDTPTIENVIAKVRAAANGPAFDRLFAGDFSPYPSQSEGDAALCGIVAFWSNGDAGVVDAIFRQSKLLRDKWDEQHSSDGRTYGEMTVDSALEKCSDFYDWTPGKAKFPPKSYTLGVATFTVKSSDFTPKKTLVTVEITIDGIAVDVVAFSSATSNRAAAAKAIKARCFCGDDPTTIQQIDSLLGVILVDASKPKEQAKEERPAEAKDVHELLEEYIPPRLQLAYRTEGSKAYSRAIGDELGRAEFVARYTCKEIIELCSQAFDAPRDEDDIVIRPKLIPFVKQELEVLWGHLISQLKSADETELTDDDPAVADLKQLVIDAWTRPCSMGIHTQKNEKGHAIQLATRTSMASKVRRMRGENTTKFQDKWTQIHESYSAFYREEMGDHTKGELVAYLAMKFELFGQVGLTPKKVKKRSFKNLGIKYRILESPPEEKKTTSDAKNNVTESPASDLTDHDSDPTGDPSDETTSASDSTGISLVPHRMSNGGKLMVLSRLMTERILSTPGHELKNNLSDQESSVTESPDPHSMPSQ